MENKVFVATFAGVYIGGSIAAVATTKSRAFGEMKRSLKAAGLLDNAVKGGFTKADLRELDLSKPGALIIDNGDY